MKLPVSILLGIILLGNIKLIAIGSIYWVSTTGNDTTGTGTLAAPYLTAAKAASLSLNGGDFVVFRNGTFSVTCGSTSNDYVTINNVGSSGSPITFKSEHQYGAVFDSANTCGYIIRTGSASKYVTIDGLTLNNGASGCGFESGDHNIWIRNDLGYCGNIINNSSGGINPPGLITSTVATNVTIDSNKIHDVGRTNFGCGTVATGTATFTTGSTLTVTTLTGTFANGQVIQLNSGAQVPNIPTDNLITNVSGSTVTISPTPTGNGTAVSIAGATECNPRDHPLYLEGSNLTVQNNEIWNFSRGWAMAVKNSSGFWHIWHNSVRGPAGHRRDGVIVLGDDLQTANLSNFIIQNNFLMSPATQAIVTCGVIIGGTNAIDHNMSDKIVTYINSGGNGGGEICDTTSGQGTITVATNTNNVNALMVNLAATPPDFHIPINSPGVDAAANVGVLLDFEGNTRPQGPGYDIGAFEVRVNTAGISSGIAFSGAVKH